MSHAIQVGRYSVVTRGHLESVRTVLRDWDRASVYVLDFDAHPAAAPPGLIERFPLLYRYCDMNCAPELSPHSVRERVSFWRAAIEQASLSVRVDVVSGPRPEPFLTIYGDRARVGTRTGHHESLSTVAVSAARWHGLDWQVPSECDPAPTDGTRFTEVGPGIQKGAHE